MEPWDTWRHQSPPPLGGGPGAMDHVATPEPSRTWSESGATGHVVTLEHSSTGRQARCHRSCSNVRALPHQEQVWNHGTRGYTGALLCREASPVPWVT
jgi:hypothetical protein